MNRITTRDPEALRKRREDAVKHMEFVCKLYKRQMDRRRLFLQEHPAQADSWSEECVRRVADSENVDTVVVDQCQYGQCDGDGNPIKKPTRWMSNSPHILRSLSARCTGRGGWCSGTNALKKHIPASGRIARDAAIYQFQLCRATLEGLREEMISRGRMSANLNIFAPFQLLKGTLDVNPIDH